MRQIGFKNFRKFENFPVIDLSPITIFVGENNAGKSTVVKAILSIIDFFKSSVFDDIPSETLSNEDYFEKAKEQLFNRFFYFNKNYFAHIGTFSRAKNNKSDDNKITFIITLDTFTYEIIVEGDLNDKEAVNAKVIFVKIHKADYNIDYEFDMKEKKMSYIFHPGLSKLYLKDEQDGEDEDIDDSKDDFSKRYRLFKKNRKTILEGYNKFAKSFSKKIVVTTDLTWGKMHSFSGQYIDNLLHGASRRMLATLKAEDEIKSPLDSDEYDDNDIIQGLPDETMNFLLKNAEIIREIVREDIFNVSMYTRLNVEYFYAHAVTPTVIYSAKDTNDYIVKTIHEFSNAKIKKDSKADKFIRKWMDVFGIGKNYNIISVGGEAHLVKITNKDGGSVNLSDKGMGSIQLMVLLFKIATLLGRRMSKNANIIIEEPEQNLHPMLQSKLADLFYELNKNYGFRFIIETHSEYLVRRSQVIVSENFNDDKKIKNNPYRVYYFPSEGIPYEVKYRTNGRFENDFGKGFFDEAANLTFKLF